MIPPVTTPGSAGAVGAANAAAYGMLNPYAQLTRPPMLTTQPATTLATPTGLNNVLTNGLTTLGAQPNPYAQPNAAFQPLMYWYPSPPVSPQSPYYVQGNLSTIVVKGLPFTVAVADVLSLLEGIYDQVGLKFLYLCSIMMVTHLSLICTVDFNW